MQEEDDMSTRSPVGELDPRFSSEGAAAAAWDEARDRFAAARLYWIATVRRDGRPHVTPLSAVWSDGSPHFCTGPGEQKARNIERNPRCALTAGGDALEGLDVVVEGEAVRVTEDARLRRLADAWVAKYGEDWRFEVRDGAFAHPDNLPDGDGQGSALVFEIVPAKALGFRKGDEFSQTRWRLGAG
jgi:predicted pyridoxine 5'-phosphate oxidase superfamily flavin-nucleotide-binding protein